MLRVLINKYNPKAGNALLNFLPEEELKELSSMVIPSDNLQPILQHPLTLLHKVHHTWIKPLIDRYPEKLHPAFFATLSKDQMNRMKVSGIAVSKPAKTFLSNQLYTDLKLHEHLPVEYLPETELSPLLSLTKAQLVDLIDLFGIYDLAAEVKQIVNREHLKNIQSCLTAKQLQFLKKCLTEKKKVIASKLGIDPSKPDRSKLKQAIHMHGLLRLGKALCGQHTDFVWTLAHCLDMGRGNILLKEYHPAEIAKITPFLKQELFSTLNFMQGQKL